MEFEILVFPTYTEAILQDMKIFIEFCFCRINWRTFLKKILSFKVSSEVGAANVAHLFIETIKCLQVLKFGHIQFEHNCCKLEITRNRKS